MNTAGGSSISPRVGTCMLAGIYFVAMGLAIPAVKMFGRKQLLVPGHVLMAICHFMVGVFAVE
jgi:Sugar (and other) transporter